MEQRQPGERQAASSGDRSPLGRHPHLPPSVAAQLEVYWGYPLKPVDTPGGNLQDLGLHLQFVVTAL